jgi:hypothetical protein
MVAVILGDSSSGLVSEAKRAVAGTLIDPESARYENVKVQKELSVVCGLVNAKNKFGGYVGFKQFYYL